MALYIRDEEVNELAPKAVSITGAKSKTAVVKDALEAFIETHTAHESFAQKVAKVQEMASAYGICADSAEDKDLMDEMWGEG